VYTVSELVAGVRELLEVRVGQVWVAGEVSNVHAAASGHFYFTLKDAGAQLRAVLFRGDARRTRFEPEDGLEVVAQGEMSLYASRGDLQLIVRRLEPQGRGALQVAFEQLRARLDAEGLFDPEGRRPLPMLPRRIAVVTSARGAAIRDVIEVTGARFPSVPLLIAPTRVQGEGAEDEIAAALARAAAEPEVDLVLLVRGGGSLEDLLPYNTERVARALRACPVPVISGVGHEVDVTIADLAADARAPTPSAAAALAVPSRPELAEGLRRDHVRLETALRRYVERASDRHARIHEALRAASPAARLRGWRERQAAGARSLFAASRRGLERARSRLETQAARLDALSPLAVLARGYAIARHAGTGAIVRRVGEVAAGDPLRVRVADGEVVANVIGSEPIHGAIGRRDD
jgi:exodeoxyribonuclease VII large subunit